MKSSDGTCFASHETVVYFYEGRRIGKWLEAQDYIWDSGIVESILLEPLLLNLVVVNV